MNDPYASDHKISKALSMPQTFLSQALAQVPGAHVLTHSERGSPYGVLALTHLDKCV